MRIPALLTLLALLLASGPVVRAQSLADVAKKEEDRRKTVNSTGKVYTNHDLKAVPAPSSEPSSEPLSDTSAQGAPDATNATPDPADTRGADTTQPDATLTDSQPAGDTIADHDAADEGLKDEEYWQTRMQRLSAQLDRDKLMSEALQTRVSSLTADFAGRDDPAQRAKIGVDRQKALAELDRLKKVVVADTKALAALEEEARSAGVPPGWLR